MTVSERSDAVVLYVMLYFVEYSGNKWYISANGSEKIYKENSNFVGVYDEVGPSTTKRTFIIFEGPKDTSAADYMLVNTNDNGEPRGYNLK